MTKDDIHLLYEYDRWANNRVLQAVSVLTAEQFTRDLGSSFRSVRDTLLHIIGGAWIWLGYWKSSKPHGAIVAHPVSGTDCANARRASSKRRKRLRGRRNDLFGPQLRIQADALIEAGAAQRPILIQAHCALSRPGTGNLCLPVQKPEINRNRSLIQPIVCIFIVFTFVPLHSLSIAKNKIK
jgi:hypothetical protein